MSNEQGARPHVGIGVIVMRGGKVLMGKRKNAHGEGTWAFPGGHLEYGESFDDCAKREVMEETSMTIASPVVKGPYTNAVFENEQKHYVTLYLIAKDVRGEPEVREPDKCEGWAWFDWDKLPSPRFKVMDQMIAEGFDPRRI